MNASNYIKVFSGSFINVQRIVTLLEEQGIIPVIKDESESGRLAGFGAAIQGLQDIYVTYKNSKVANAIIANLQD